MFGHFHSPRTFFWPRTCCNCGRRRLPFLLPSLDKALGGGIAGGEGIAEISGPPGVGKTSLALQLAVSLAAGCAQSADCICLARERTVLPSATRTRHRDPTTSPSRARPANHQDSNTSVEEQSAGIDGGRHGLTCKRRRSSPAPAQIHDPRNSLCCGPRFLGKAASDLPDCRHRASEVSPAALPSSAMSARRRRRFPGSRRTLFIDSEGGVRSQRVLQVVAAHLGDNGAGYRAPTAQAVREEHRESLQTDADAPNEGWLGRMRGTFPGGSAQRCGLASETDGDSAFVLSCIDVARVFDHEELLSLLQHVLLAVMNVAEDSSDEKAFPPSGQLPKDKQDARSLEGSDHSRHYALIVVDSLSWIYHPAFFRSAADCTALLMQTVGILRFLSYKFGVAVVVTNQLTANWDSGGSVAAEHGESRKGDREGRQPGGVDLADVLGVPVFVSASRKLRSTDIFLVGFLRFSAK